MVPKDLYYGPKLCSLILLIFMLQVMGEMFCKAMHSESFNTIVLRVSRVYGKGLFAWFYELLHKFARLITTGEELPVSGDGSQIMDLIHIRDLSRAVIKACNMHWPGNNTCVFNIGGGKPVSIGEFATICIKSARDIGLHGPGIKHTEGNDPRHFGMDIHHARTMLDWKPSLGLKEAMTELILDELS